MIARKVSLKKKTRRSKNEEKRGYLFKSRTTESVYLDLKEETRSTVDGVRQKRDRRTKVMT